MALVLNFWEYTELFFHSWNTIHFSLSWPLGLISPYYKCTSFLLKIFWATILCSLLGFTVSTGIELLIFGRLKICNIWTVRNSLFFLLNYYNILKWCEMISVVVFSNDNMISLRRSVINQGRHKRLWSWSCKNSDNQWPEPELNIVAGIFLPYWPLIYLYFGKCVFNPLPKNFGFIFYWFIRVLPTIFKDNSFWIFLLLYDFLVFSSFILYSLEVVHLVGSFIYHFFGCLCFSFTKILCQIHKICLYFLLWVLSF